MTIPLRTCEWLSLHEMGIIHVGPGQGVCSICEWPDAACRLEALDAPICVWCVREPWLVLAYTERIARLRAQETRPTLPGPTEG